MKSKVVITSIYPPGKAIKGIAAQDLDLIVIGDKKTPADWTFDKVRFLGVEEQVKLNYGLIKVLPFNHYGRKMIGYLEAIRLGADTIIDTDDDNIPKPGWKFPAFDGIQDVTAKNKGFVNVYSHYSKKHIWPRGLPLDRINNPAELSQKREVSVGVWQALADGDPDVDAIYRLVDNEPCTFSDSEPLVLDKGTLSPFNSQNTAFRKELFPLLYLPAYVTFRFTDILRGWVAQPIMWSAGYSLGFTTATVVQERNPHDYTKDFESEIPCYLYGNRVLDAVADAIDPKKSVSENLRLAYQKLFEIEIVSRDELKLLDEWLNDIEVLSTRRR